MIALLSPHPASTCITLMASDDIALHFYYSTRYCEHPGGDRDIVIVVLLELASSGIIYLGLSQSWLLHYVYSLVSRRAGTKVEDLNVVDSVG